MDGTLNLSMDFWIKAAMMTSMKPNSYGGSGGANEITMNDAPGAEGLFMKAQKDEVHIVGNDRDDTVGGDEKFHVIGNRDRTATKVEKVKGIGESLKLQASFLQL